MSYEIWYVGKVATNDIPKLLGSYKDRIKQAIETKLATEPDLYGKPLRKSLKGYFKLRVGDYRIIFRIESQPARNATHSVAGGKVKIFAIAHRKIVYEIMGGRT